MEGKSEGLHDPGGKQLGNMSLGVLNDTLKDINLKASSCSLGAHQRSILAAKGHRTSSRGDSISASPGNRDNSSDPCPVQAGTNFLSFSLVWAGQKTSADLVPQEPSTLVL